MRKTKKRDRQECAVPAFVEALAESYFLTYREMHDLLRQTEKRGKENPDFEALARNSPNAGDLIEMHNMAKREVELLRLVHRWMDDFSQRGLPTPKIVLDFNREISGTKEAETDTDAKRALFYECLANDPCRSIKGIADEITKRIGKISWPTIREWRSEPEVEAFIETTEFRRFLGINPVNPFAVDDSQRHLQMRIELKAFRKQFPRLEDRVVALQRLDEIHRRRKGISPEPVLLPEALAAKIKVSFAGI